MNSLTTAGMSDIASFKDMKSDRRQSGGGDIFENVSGDLLGMLIHAMCNGRQNYCVYFVASR